MRTIGSTLLLLAVSGFSAAGARAGAITASVVKHDLVVTGSAGDDDLAIVQATGGKHRFQLSPAAGSTVNGSASDVFLDGVSGDLRIDLRGGTNSASVAGAAIEGDVRLDQAAAGSVLIVFGDVTVKHDVVARSDAGSLFITGSALRVAGDFDVRGGGATDQLVFVGGCSIGRRMNANLGGGANLIQLMQCGISGPVTLRGGAGADAFLSLNATLGRLSIDFGDGTNSAVLQDVVVRGNFRFDGGDALDEVDTVSATIEGGVATNLRGGANSLALTSLVAKRGLSVRAGGADDTMQLGEDSRIGGACNVSLGSGHNVLTAKNSSVGSLRVRGGSGKDENSIENLRVDGSCRFDLGAAPAGPGDKLSLASSTCFGSFALRSKGGDDEVMLSILDVAGAANVSLGEGNNHLDSQGLRARSLGVRAGNGNDDFVLVLFDTVGAARFALGGGTNSAQLAASTAGGDLAVRAGAGDDTLQLAAVVVGGKQIIHLGGGANTGP